MKISGFNYRKETSSVKNKYEFKEKGKVKELFFTKNQSVEVVKIGSKITVS